MDTNYYNTYWSRNQSNDWFPSIKNSLNSNEQRIFEKYLIEGAKIIDYGCGDGERYGQLLRQAGFKYVGCDISEEAVKYAKRQGIPAYLLNPNGQTELESSSFDFSICYEVLEHVMNPEICLQEIHRLLKPTGYLTVSTPNAAYLPYRLEFFLTGFLSPGGSPLTSRKAPWRDAHIRFFNPKMLRNLLEHCNFEIVEFVPQQFNLTQLPLLYKAKQYHRFLASISLPIKGLGVALPGIFSARTIYVARPRK